LRSANKIPGGIGKPSLIPERNSQVLVCVMPVRIDFDGSAAILFRLPVPFCLVEAVSGVVIEETPYLI
jgi:hypothetical protein